MWLYKPLQACAIVMVLAGCGFRPLYAPPQEDVSGQGVYAFDIFQSLAINNIEDRNGQFFRNRLIHLLHPAGRRGAAKYLLSVQLNESTASLAVQRSAIATRANLTVTGSYRLTGVESRGSVLSGSIQSSSGYNIFQSEFQTLMAEKGARERALEDLAQQLRVRLAALLTTSGAQTAKP